MRNIQHWIAGSGTSGASTRFGPVDFDKPKPIAGRAYDDPRSAGIGGDQ
jgi:hypothetical protein